MTAPTDREVLERLEALRVMNASCLWVAVPGKNPADEQTIPVRQADLTHILRRYAEMAKALEVEPGRFGADVALAVNDDPTADAALNALTPRLRANLGVAIHRCAARTFRALTEKDDTPDV